MDLKNKGLEYLKYFTKEHTKHPVGSTLNYSYDITIIKELEKGTKNHTQSIMYIRCKDCCGEGRCVLDS